MSIAINKGNTILAEINLSPIASYGYTRYIPIIESKGFKITSSTLEINGLDKYQLGYKKGSGILDLGIITFSSSDSESILRSSFSDYDFVLTKINLQDNGPIPAENKPKPEGNTKKKDNPEPKVPNNPEDETDLPLDEKNESIPELNQKIVDQAKLFIGSSDWSWTGTKISYDGKALFGNGEFKCNLFVYDVLGICGIKMDLPNQPGRFRKFIIKSERPYTTKQWYNEQVPNFKYIGKGVKALEQSVPGDIITDGKHMGIISGPQLVISASSRPEDENKVVENEWGWREDIKNNVKIFRYIPNSKDIEEQTKEENLSNKKKKIK